LNDNVYGILLGSSLYIIVMGLTWYWLRFTHFYHFQRDNPQNRRSGDDPFPYVLWIFWPIFYICLGGLGIGVFFMWGLRIAAHCLDMGVERILRRKIHQDEFGELYHVPDPEHGHSILKIKVQDSTGIYWLTVPPTMQRAKQAVAWTYNMNEDEFSPIRV
jgi:hypothetical protein